MTDFGRLAALCGLSDAALADRLNVREDTVRHWRSGRREPPPNVLDELADLAEPVVIKLTGGVRK